MTLRHTAAGGARVKVPDGSGSSQTCARTWTYDSSNRLTGETQLESQTTSYSYYAGTTLLSQKTDATGTTSTFQYDANGRVWRITAGGRVTEITYEVGWDNRALATVTDGGATTWTRAATRCSTSRPMPSAPSG